MYLKDLWPSQQEIAEAVEKVKTDMFRKEYAEVFDGDDTWKSIKVPESKVYEWSDKSTYIQHPPFFEGLKEEPDAIDDIKDANILALLGDSVTTDHISPSGSFKADTLPANTCRSTALSRKTSTPMGPAGVTMR